MIDNNYIKVTIRAITTLIAIILIVYFAYDFKYINEVLFIISPYFILYFLLQFISIKLHKKSFLLLVMVNYMGDTLKYPNILYALLYIVFAYIILTLQFEYGLIPLNT